MLQNKMEMNRKQLRVLSHTLKLYHFTVWLMCSVVLSVEAEFPSNCTRINSSLICTDYEEITLPFEVPKWTRELTLNKKNMTVLISRAFSANGTDVYLYELSLKDNNIQVIESCAFCGLPRLQTLDLSRNRLKNVSSEAFYGLENLLFLYLNNTLTTPVVSALPRALYSLGELDKLHLSGNCLKSIPLLDFGNLNELILTNNSIATLNETDLTHLKTHNVTSIFLKDNPFKCTCDENKFYVWLQNGSQCKDKNDLKCSQPKEKEGKSVLDKDNCKKAQDLRSFVLLGIVLALIGVVFLMVLYLNRRGIKRWLNNIREACRDQMEVYHYRYEQDSDPRLANVAV